MKYVVDRIENEIAVLESIETKEIIEVPIKELPTNIIERKVLKLENGSFLLDEEEQKSRLELLKEKMKKLKKENK